eukprot:gene12754-26861_t
MGCSSSHNPYKDEPDLLIWRNHLFEIGFRDNNVEFLHKLYLKLEGIENSHGSNLIHASTILDYIDVEPNKFASRILSMLQMKEGGIIENFKQFCFSIWNFGTMGDISLATCAHCIYYSKQMNEIEKSNMVLMVHEAIPKEADIATPKIIKQIQDTPTNIGTWNLDNFTKFVRTHTYLFHKIKVIQIKFRERIFGTSLWSKLINIRDTLGEEAVADLFLEVCPVVFDGFSRSIHFQGNRGKETPETLSNRTDTTTATTSISRRQSGLLARGRSLGYDDRNHSSASLLQDDIRRKSTRGTGLTTASGNRSMSTIITIAENDTTTDTNMTTMNSSPDYHSYTRMQSKRSIKLENPLHSTSTSTLSATAVAYRSPSGKYENQSGKCENNGKQPSRRPSSVHEDQHQHDTAAPSQSLYDYKYKSKESNNNTSNNSKTTTTNPTTFNRKRSSRRRSFGDENDENEMKDDPGKSYSTSLHGTSLNKNNISQNTLVQRNSKFLRRNSSNNSDDDCSHSAPIINESLNNRLPKLESNFKSNNIPLSGKHSNSINNKSPAAGSVPLSRTNTNTNTRHSFNVSSSS